MENLNGEAVKLIADLAKAEAVILDIPGSNVPCALMPPGYSVKPIPEVVFNEHRATPDRVRGNITVLDPGSFVEYHTLFSDVNSRVFADETTLKVLAVLDYHGAAEGGPRWGQHRLTLDLRKSEEWKIWTGANNKQMTQQSFAEFLEQNSLDISKPAPADIVEVANDLQATTEVSFGSGLRQQNGQVKFKYTEEVKATVGGGAVSVPERFTVTIPAFIGGERVPMDALLRFRVKEGKLTFWYTLVRPEEVIRSAFIEARNRVAEDLKITIINGSPA